MDRSRQAVCRHHVLLQLRHLHNHYTTLYKGIARQRTGVFEAVAKWRLEHDSMRFPLDAKLFHVVNSLEKRLFPNRRITRDLVDQALG